MNIIPDIITIPVIPSSIDVFWDTFTTGLQPRPLLILSAPFTDENAENVQLTKMLHASKIAAESYNLIILHEGDRLAWSKLQDALQPKAVLLLGVAPQDVGISALFRLNEPNHFSNCIFIATLSIAKLETMPDMKRQLWNSALKPLFIDNLYGFH